MSDALQEVKQEREHLAKRQKTHASSLNGEIDNLIEFIEALKQKLQNGTQQLHFYKNIN